MLYTFLIRNTTGSRSKEIIVNPNTEDEYFFKGLKELDIGESANEYGC